MEGLKLYSPADILALTRQREGEVKLGEKVQTLSSLNDLKQSSAPFVLLGIPEDIGVRANYGIAGTASAWEASLRSLLNIQSNSFLNGAELLVLGHFKFKDPKETDPAALSKKVEAIDDLVYPVIQKIIEAGKTPIVIGGGHNNAYPIIKGVSQAKGKEIDVVNIDAHADLRETNGRHSGNGFSYAIKDNYLKNYSIFGLHENYNNHHVLQQIKENPHINCIYFDELIKTKDRTQLLHNFVQPLDYNLGLEIDLDSIENVLSSASTPSGFTLNDMRRLVLNGKKKFHYLHLCEGAIELSDGRKDPNTAKTIVYLITDFIKAQLNL
ncbi:arginase [Pedobacter sp. HMWF019]|uniref:formimidoylglutamase n=1 Tax=Pedobacter sp. HMWF019 TaxID=2056856 RepID=UPI000D35B05E|nr:formimidoylglutamase [Pedobacter sp. HMWF019]PTT03223.1 arginase [Pedobacter sp. HMWF019]